MASTNADWQYLHYIQTVAAQNQICTCHRRKDPASPRHSIDARLAQSRPRAGRPQTLHRAFTDSIIPLSTQSASFNARPPGPSDSRVKLHLETADMQLEQALSGHRSTSIGEDWASVKQNLTNRNAALENALQLEFPVDNAALAARDPANNTNGTSYALKSDNLPDHIHAFAPVEYNFAVGPSMMDTEYSVSPLRTADDLLSTQFQPQYNLSYDPSTELGPLDAYQYPTTSLLDATEIGSSSNEESDIESDDAAADHEADTTTDSRKMSAQGPLTTAAFLPTTFGISTTRRKWTMEEDLALTKAVQIYAHHPQRWKYIAQSVQNRSSKLCAKRWKYLECLSTRNAKKGKWAPEEDAAVISALQAWSNGPVNWNKIAESLPYPRSSAQVQARYAEKLDPTIKKGWWSPEEIRQLEISVKKHHGQWFKVCQDIPGRTQRQCRTRYLRESLSGTFDEVSPHIQ